MDQTLAETPQLLLLSRVLVSRLQAEKNKTALRYSDPDMRSSTFYDCRFFPLGTSASTRQDPQNGSRQDLPRAEIPL